MKHTRNQAGPHRPGPSGEPIRVDELYPWSALYTRLGWGARSIAVAKTKGLRVLRFANRQYVLGRDVIAFLESIQGETQNTPVLPCPRSTLAYESEPGHNDDHDTDTRCEEGDEAK